MVNITVPTSSGECKIEVDVGETLLFLGPNGSGKSRLGVMIEGKQPRFIVSGLTDHCR